MKHTQKFIEQRKLVMAIPVLVLPFLTIMFWALGGGIGKAGEAKTAKQSGLNLELPNAHFDKEQLDKLSLYERARKDSLKFQEARDNDPYFKLELNRRMEEDLAQFVTPEATQNQAGIRNEGKSRPSSDPNEIMVKGKLDELYKELNRKPDNSLRGQLIGRPTVPIQNSGISLEMKQMESMMEMMHSKQGTDPDGERISTMLDKILDIQHPERMRERIREQSSQKKGQVFPVERLEISSNISLMDSDKVNSRKHTRSTNSFYDLEDEGTITSNNEGQIEDAIEAVIHHTQDLVVGATVKMRLLGDVYINGKLIPKDHFLFGTAGINGERLTISINSIRNDKSLFPVSLAAYDLDGLEGIYIPGAITRDAAKQSSDQAMQSMQFMTMDQSLGAQAGAAGVQAAKGLFSKKVKLVKVTVKAGYRILLKDGKGS